MTFDLDGMLRRLHLPTVRRLYPELESRAETEGLSHRDFLAVLMAEEIAHRAQTRIARSLRKAHFPFLRTIEDFDFTFQTSVRLHLLGSYLGPELVTEGRNLILCGPSGTGKTHLAVAMAYRAIQNGYDALFTSAAVLVESLSAATRRGELAEVLPRYTHPHVLVIDEVGYLTVGGDAANVLFQVVNDRYLHRRPMIFTTNKPLAAWGLVLHDPDLAEAILDRVLERGRLIELRGESYRTRHLGRQKPERSPAKGARISGKQGPPFPEPTLAAPLAGEGTVLGSPDRPRRTLRTPSATAGDCLAHETVPPTQSRSVDLRHCPPFPHFEPMASARPDSTAIRWAPLETPACPTTSSIGRPIPASKPAAARMAPDAFTVRPRDRNGVSGLDAPSRVSVGQMALAPENASSALRCRLDSTLRKRCPAAHERSRDPCPAGHGANEPQRLDRRSTPANRLHNNHLRPSPLPGPPPALPHPVTQRATRRPTAGGTTMNPQTPRTLADRSAQKEPSFVRAAVGFGIVLVASLVVGVLIAGRDKPQTAATSTATRARATQRATAPAVTTPAAAPVITTPAVVSPEPIAIIEQDLTPATPATYQDAEAAYLSGDFDTAAELFASYTADKPNNPWGHYMSGLAYRQVGKLDDAERAFLACLAIDPNHIKSLVNLGRARLDLGNASGAEEVVRRASTLDPENVDAHRVLARALHTQGKCADALDEYAAALALAPTDAWSLNNRGLILIEEERFAEAVESLTSACNADATHAVFHNNLGVALERTGRFHDAELAYAAALNLDSRYEKAAVSLARVDGKENVEEPLTAAYASVGADSAPVEVQTAPIVSRLDDPR